MIKAVSVLVLAAEEEAATKRVDRNLPPRNRPRIPVDSFRNGQRRYCQNLRCSQARIRRLLVVLTKPPATHILIEY